MMIEERLRMLETRVARAERSKRRQLVAGLGVLLALFALLGADSSMTGGGTNDQGPTGEKQIRANSFILVDEDGRERARLAATKDGTRLTLYDEKGQRRAMLGAGVTETPDGKVITYPESFLRLFGPDGREITSLP